MRPESLRGYGPVGTNGPESFDAVLEAMRAASPQLAGFADRLQSAHARELAEQQAAIEALRAELAACDRNLADAMNVIAAGDTRADAAMGLLREVSRNGWGNLGPTDLIHETPLLDRIDAFLAQQALAGGERKE